MRYTVPRIFAVAFLIATVLERHWRWTSSRLRLIRNSDTSRRGEAEALRAEFERLKIIEKVLAVQEGVVPDSRASSQQSRHLDHPPPPNSNSTSTFQLLKVRQKLARHQRRLVANYLRSINHDSKFLRSTYDIMARSEQLTSLFHVYFLETTGLLLPLFANLRNGLWYSSDFNGTCYFKSTDGHPGKWAFSTTRLNLHVAAAASEHGGIVIADSSRSREFPDAFSRTVPIWCAVLNRAVIDPNFPVVLPAFINETERSIIINQKIPEFVRILKSLQIPAASLKQAVRRPLLPVLISPQTPLSMMKRRENVSTVFLVSVSSWKNRLLPDTSTGSDGNSSYAWSYIQGAGDDEENWALGLRPQVYWRHREKLLSEDDPYRLQDEVIKLSGTSKTGQHHLLSVGENRGEGGSGSKTVWIGSDSNDSYRIMKHKKKKKDNKKKNEKKRKYKCDTQLGVRISPFEAAPEEMEGGATATRNRSSLLSPLLCSNVSVLIDCYVPTLMPLEEQRHHRLAIPGCSYRKQGFNRSYWTRTVFPTALALYRKCMEEAMGVMRESEARMPPPVRCIVHSTQSNEEAAVAIVLSLLVYHFDERLHFITNSSTIQKCPSTNGEDRHQTPNKKILRTQFAALQRFIPTANPPRRLLKTISATFEGHEQRRNTTSLPSKTEVPTADSSSPRSSGGGRRRRRGPRRKRSENQERATVTTTAAIE
eukprot:jgi/Bigna1/73987/fgenesh1_pg.27_\